MSDAVNSALQSIDEANADKPAATRRAAVIAYAGLLGAWVLVAARTTKQSLRGDLLLRPPASGPVVAVKR